MVPVIFQISSANRGFKHSNNLGDLSTRYAVLVSPGPIQHELVWSTVRAHFSPLGR